MDGVSQDFQVWPQHAAAVYGRALAGGPLVVCEHAARTIPPGLNDLGLPQEALVSHVAWDIGALDVALRLSAHLGAACVAGTISRLVYDCNRPLEAAGAIPEESEIYKIPGNQGLSPAQRQQRFDAVHQPFHDAVDHVAKRAGTASALITVHSFTPIYHGKPRDTELGLLFDADPRLAQALLKATGPTGLKAALNVPYGPQDGVMHTLHLHGQNRGIPHVMIEIRNDLVDTPGKAQSMADRLFPALQMALAEVCP
ncbi:MAG: N-formylglutamate amidohydrolase [Roseobacter sp.]